MNEEWFGICAKGPSNERGLYQLFPRAAAQNPDGSIAAIIFNQDTESKNFALTLGEKSTNVSISGQAIQTIIISKSTEH